MPLVSSEAATKKTNSLGPFACVGKYARKGLFGTLFVPACPKAPSCCVHQGRVEAALLAVHRSSPIWNPDQDVGKMCEKLANKLRAFLGKFRKVKKEQDTYDKVGVVRCVVETLRIQRFANPQ